MSNRRDFIKNVSFTLCSTVMIPPLVSLIENARAQTGAGKGKKVGVALVGLGKYSTEQLAPALQKTKNCYLAGIVTGTPAKARSWKEKFNIPEKNIYNYENFDQIANNPDIDVVYIVLPNGMHAEYTIRAAKAKKHVICEKPMATSVEDAEKMIRACQDNKVHLSIGYRLHYEPYHQRVMELGQREVYGKVLEVEAADSGDNTTGDPNIWRLDKELAGGGPLMDLGVYCVQGACYNLGKDPIAVTAKFGPVTNKKYFDEVEESIEWEMEFENGVKARCRSSYSKDENFLSGKAEKGWWRVEPAYAYEGKSGVTSEGKMNFPDVFEQALQMDSQTASFRDNKPNLTPGEMGLRDVKILMAIYESARNGGKRIKLS